MDQLKEAYRLLKEWKGDSYIFGLSVIDQIGKITLRFGKKALLVSNTTYMKPFADTVVKYLNESGVELAGGCICPDAKPNAPREDVYRIESYILHTKPDCIIALGGGSTIDACKAACALATLGGKVTPEIDHYFGTGVVTKELQATHSKMLPLIAIETSASSGAHLTKYANITDPVIGQKKLIVDESIVPDVSVFDYSVTKSMPLKVTIDGALDAIAHTFEVFCGAKEASYDKTKELAECAISLCAEYAHKLIANPSDMQAREAIGLATDLGGYAIMIGGTSGAHLTSFSLVDIVGHGTACGIMNPYYAILYSKAIQPQLKVVGKIFKKFGYTNDDVDNLSGRDLALSVAKAMIAYGKSINAPTTLGEIEGFTEEHIKRALSAAKDPQLDMKLRNMPVPMNASLVDEYMGPVLRAAVSGDMSIIKEL
ncbi:iron-containing alcohol dehydrogenase [Treponema socranskii]|uniref:Alcohol dehydrogenase, iron-dependent n=1 Tax=Treponema socranskii subsp. socranskii VPI DR56BR1116 = ATCC 35536 TaxID=1125725 RepID=A0ABN0P6B8_TRESO|nr:iron-containing alcohol dehydrogenase [Treponema socranskii]ERK04445.1 alcohol dehydrogenase, iron-dependent [Treponema socranskii subsp. socranskii VPI DR56BR1116 = ATCC 35536]MDR9860176.1 iron-containing alcohol dehydrogenase [Treponema socranskii]